MAALPLPHPPPAFVADVYPSLPSVPLDAAEVILNRNRHFVWLHDRGRHRPPTLYPPCLVRDSALACAVRSVASAAVCFHASPQGRARLPKGQLLSGYCHEIIKPISSLRQPTSENAEAIASRCLFCFSDNVGAIVVGAPTPINPGQQADPGFTSGSHSVPSPSLHWNCCEPQEHPCTPRIHRALSAYSYIFHQRRRRIVGPSTIARNQSEKHNQASSSEHSATVGAWWLAHVLMHPDLSVSKAQVSPPVRWTWQDGRVTCLVELFSPDGSQHLSGRAHVIYSIGCQCRGKSLVSNAIYSGNRFLTSSPLLTQMETQHSHKQSSTWLGRLFNSFHFESECRSCLSSKLQTQAVPVKRCNAPVNSFTPQPESA